MNSLLTNSLHYLYYLIQTLSKNSLLTYQLEHTYKLNAELIIQITIFNMASSSKLWDSQHCKKKKFSKFPEENIYMIWIKTFTGNDVKVAHYISNRILLLGSTYQKDIFYIKDVKWDGCASQGIRPPTSTITWYFFLCTSPIYFWDKHVKHIKYICATRWLLLL